MFNKKQLLSVLISVVVLTMTCVSIHAETVPTITVEDVTANMGETVSIPISIASNTGICGATLTINYDNRLVLTSIDRGSALPDLAMTKPGNLSANPFNIVWDGTDADNSNGTMVVLNFTVPNVSGSFNVNISYDYGDIVDDSLSPIDVMTKNGLITVENNSGEGGNDNPEQNDSISISIDSVTADSGGSIDVPISITNNTGICGATISVNYDNRLTLTKISKGEALSSLTMTKPGNLSANPAKIVWDGTDADNSNGTIAILTFSVPNNAGKYNITLSYDDGDIVDGNLSPVDLDVSNGCIKVVFSNQITVKINEKGVVLSGSSNEGKIIVSFYDDNGKMISLNIYDVDNIQTVCSESVAHAKVMWWSSISSMKPMCNTKTINFR